MSRRRRLLIPTGVVTTGTILLSLAAVSSSSAATKLRFLHAVPGAPAAHLTISGPKSQQATLPGVGFAKASGYASGPGGSITLALAAGGKELARAEKTLADGGAYTIVAEKGKAASVAFRVYRSGRAAPGKTRFRAVHAAPEVGKVDMSLGGRRWGAVDFGHDTGYKPAGPGTYRVTARKAGMGSTLLERKGVNAAAGTAVTAYAVGSAGERTRFVVVQDSVAAPSGAPDTGLGGMAESDDTPWLAALLAALGAGSLGGVLYTRAPRARARARS